MLKRPRRSGRNVQRGPGLFVLRSLPDEALAEIKRHLSRQDWDCFCAACRFPLCKGLRRPECNRVEIGDGTRQERALLSDPLAQPLLVTLSVKQGDRRILQKLQNLSNLKYLSLFDCGVDVPIRCGLTSLKTLTLSSCVIDASGCPAVCTLTRLTVTNSKVLLSRSGHPFPLVSRDAQSLEALNLGYCDVVDVAGTGHFHLDAPRLAFLELRCVRFHTHNTQCSLAGAQGLAPSLLSALFDRSALDCRQNLRVDTLLADAFQRQVLPQLTSLQLLHCTPGYFPSTVLPLRELMVRCPGNGGCAGPRCGARQYPLGITNLRVLCGDDCTMNQAVQGVSNAAKAGLKLQELVLSAELCIQTQPCTLQAASFLGLEGKLERVTLRANKVDVASMLKCLRGCLRLSHLEIDQDERHCQASSIGVRRLGPSKFRAVTMPALERLVVPISPYSLDLRACPRLHTVHVTHAFNAQEWICRFPPLACMIVSMRTLSKLFKMPRKGKWACPKYHSWYRDGHWHAREPTGSCPGCSPIQTIQLEHSNTGGESLLY